MKLANDTYHENVTIFIMLGLHHNIILEMPWLKRHQPKIKWDSESVTFNSDTCRNYCLKFNNSFPITVFSCQHL